MVIDFGGGVLGALQRHLDPGSVHVLLSHLHADHCLDMPGLFVWRRYHPTPPKGKALLYGPSDTWSRLGQRRRPTAARSTIARTSSTSTTGWTASR
ncbi:beta-lactamase superfamily domain protein [Mycobacterium kansasii 732]|nr:beta-lactamase superfamily domain protein [Mycobacterium kansasii 732]